MKLMDTVRSLKLRPLTETSYEEKLRILQLRNQPAVRHNMYTAHEIGEAEHFAWIERLGHDDSTRFFAVELDEEIIGGVSLNAISHTHARADWAYYLDTARQGNGVGAALEFRFLDYVFGTDIQKLNCEVFAFNEGVISLHAKFGFTVEGVRRAHIRRDVQSLDVVLMGITKEEWQTTRERLTQRLFA